MTPVDPIAALAAASQAAWVSAPVTAVQPAAQVNNGHNPTMEELTQRFRSMMDAPHPVDRPPEGPQEGLLTHMMANGEEFLKQTHEKVAELRAQSPYMTPTEFISATIEVSEAASIGSFRLQAATSIASGANKSMQSLLKNQ
jgi:type III secretion inner rod protein HrpB2